MSVHPSTIEGCIEHAVDNDFGINLVMMLEEVKRKNEEVEKLIEECRQKLAIVDTYPRKDAPDYGILKEGYMTRILEITK